VLVVEDDPATLMLMCNRLRAAGFSCAAAGSGAEALALSESAKLAAVLLDLRLPDIDGLEVLAALRLQHPGIPVAVMTAHGVELGARVLSAGANAFLVKPVDRKHLIATFGRLTAWTEGAV
jgi:two-component system response regulator GlrR